MRGEELADFAARVRRRPEAHVTVHVRANETCAGVRHLATLQKQQLLHRQLRLKTRHVMCDVTSRRTIAVLPTADTSL